MNRTKKMWGGAEVALAMALVLTGGAAWALPFDNFGTAWGNANLYMQQIRITETCVPNSVGYCKFTDTVTLVAGYANTEVLMNGWKLEFSSGSYNLKDVGVKATVVSYSGGSSGSGAMVLDVETWYLPQTGAQGLRQHDEPQLRGGW